MKPTTNSRFFLLFAASADFKRTLERVGEVLGIADVAANLEKVFGSTMETLLDQKDPERKLARRRAREAKKNQEPKTQEPKSEHRPDDVRAEGNRVAPGESPYVSSRLRELVFERAGYQCQFVYEGVRCTERVGLQVDHIVPRRSLEASELENLRCLCGPHNRWAAEQVYGREFMRSKMESAEAPGG